MAKARSVYACTECGAQFPKWSGQCGECGHLLPPALGDTKRVPVDEVVTLTLYYREDEHLSRLMLDDAEKAKLDRLWDQLFFISQDALILVDALEQLIQYATQDGDPSVLTPLREPFAARAAAFFREGAGPEGDRWIVRRSGQPMHARRQGRRNRGHSISHVLTGRPRLQG